MVNNRDAYKPLLGFLFGNREAYERFDERLKEFDARHLSVHPRRPSFDRGPGCLSAQRPEIQRPWRLHALLPWWVLPVTPIPSISLFSYPMIWSNTMRVKSIKFRNTMPKKESYGLMQVVESTFKSGEEGPCGRWVESLAYNVTGSHLVIVQESYAHAPLVAYEARRDLMVNNRDAYKPLLGFLFGNREAYERFDERLKEFDARHKEWRDSVEIKEFTYKIADVLGRIETTQ
jgi:hypothetical protein